jgi:argininosuccinate lyase
MTRLWDKGLPLDARVLRYTAGEDHLLDARLVPYDVRGSIAHAGMLAETNLISDTDFKAIRDGLNELAGSFAAGDWSISLEDEDVHTALESRLTQAIGDAGARLHLGRSRNDQVLTALRLYLGMPLTSSRDASPGCVSQSMRSPVDRAMSFFPVTRTCSMRCRRPSSCGAAASTRRSPMR